MNWRIYRLPGSREVWHIDSGCRTQVFNVTAWQCHTSSHAVDVGGNHIPRAWISISGAELHIINGIAVFEHPGVSDAVRESIDVANMTREGTGRIE